MFVVYVFVILCLSFSLAVMEGEKKATGRCQLYIYNFTPDTTEDEIASHFSKFGEINELFLNKEKCFAFVRLDYRSNDEKVPRESAIATVDERGKSAGEGIAQMEYARYEHETELLQKQQWETQHAELRTREDELLKARSEDIKHLPQKWQLFVRTLAGQVLYTFMKLLMKKCFCHCYLCFLQRLFFLLSATLSQCCR